MSPGLMTALQPSACCCYLALSWVRVAGHLRQVAGRLGQVDPALGFVGHDRLAEKSFPVCESQLRYAARSVERLWPGAAMWRVILAP